MTQFDTDIHDAGFFYLTRRVKLEILTILTSQRDYLNWNMYGSSQCRLCISVRNRCSSHHFIQLDFMIAHRARLCSYELKILSALE